MVNEKPVKRMFERRKRALSRGDAVGYVHVCDLEGIEPEDPDLYVQGMVELEVLPRMESYDKKHWGRLARVALPRFPELDRGESIHASEIKRRLGEIRDAGYNVRPYSRMRKGQAWNYLMQIRVRVRGEARQHCPDILARIDSANEQAKREGIEIR